MTLLMTRSVMLVGSLMSGRLLRVQTTCRMRVFATLVWVGLNIRWRQFRPLHSMRVAWM